MCVLDTGANRFAVLPDKQTPRPVTGLFFVLYRSNIVMVRYVTLKYILAQVFCFVLFFFSLTCSIVFIWETSWNIKNAEWILYCNISAELKIVNFFERIACLTGTTDSNTFSFQFHLLNETNITFLRNKSKTFSMPGLRFITCEPRLT